jgi:hypothetical protein
MSQATHDDDTFVISSSTALGMAEYLLALLNTVVQNLPASDLRRMRNAMDQSVTLIDDLLYSISISSTFDTLTISDGMCIYLQLSVVFLLSHPKKPPPPSASMVPSALRRVPTPLAGSPPGLPLWVLNFYYVFYRSPSPRKRPLHLRRPLPR